MSKWSVAEQAALGIEVNVWANDQSGPARPAMDSDRRTELWRQRGVITVRTQDHAVLLGGTGHGLRLCALDCLDLAVPDSSEHWDDYGLGTSKTVEFIIRNQDNA